ncbi:MAG: hypothetical protein EOP04_18175 [Proteobacteria bacterium]|nr:MAG: hypothetical protein EOP04_18175 [Pseudomonadota bacterium]
MDMPNLLTSSCAHATEEIAPFVYRVSRKLGSLATAISGLDALVFTWEIGEHPAQIRRSVCKQASWLAWNSTKTPTSTATQVFLLRQARCQPNPSGLTKT